jgi:peptide/nickel transport system permease protein
MRRPAGIGGLSLPGLIGAGLVGLLLLVVAIAFVWTPQNPLSVDLDARLAGPSARHLLGTDQFGRDILSRAMAGARISVLLGIATVTCTVTLGLVIGTLAGYLRGPVEAALMMVNDALMAFPGMLLALALIAVMGPGAASIIVALTFAYLPSVVRVVRASVLSIRTREYVEASRVMGNSELYSMLRHVVPNTVPQVAVLATSMFGWVLLSESALSFLGVGIPAPAPTWGNMLASARPYLNGDAWLAVVPGLCITLALLGVNLLSDALRDLFDPRSPG